MKQLTFAELAALQQGTKVVRFHRGESQAYYVLCTYTKYHNKYGIYLVKEGSGDKTLWVPDPNDVIFPVQKGFEVVWCLNSEYNPKDAGEIMKKQVTDLYEDFLEMLDEVHFS